MVKTAIKTMPHGKGHLLVALICAAVLAFTILLGDPLDAQTTKKKPSPKASKSTSKDAKEELPAEEVKVGAPKPLSSRSLAHLYVLMKSEPPLAPIDLDYYISHLAQIISLDKNPENVGLVLEGTGWTESRLAYVCVKIGLGLMGILDSEKLDPKRYPFFVYPSKEEEELIALMEPDISKAYKAIIQKDEPRNLRGTRGKSQRRNP